jgi:hypothetical protein
MNLRSQPEAGWALYHVWPAVLLHLALAVWLDSQSDEEYAAYKARASFFGATARTVEEYLDLVFRRTPVIAFGACEQLREFVRDCDLLGADFLRYARRVVREVLSVGRGGSVLPTESGRPVVSLLKAEEIVEWGVERADNRVCLAYVVLG